jgi:two-component system OmpR family sensor kinase
VSLRTRLLLAAGAVALIALTIADVVTYNELRTFLYGQVDQQLEQSHMPIEAALRGGAPPGPAGAGAGPPRSTLAQAPTPSTPENRAESSQNIESTDATEQAQRDVASCTGFESLSDGTLRELGPGSFVQVRSPNGRILCSSVLPQFGTNRSAVPTLPRTLTGFVSNASDFGEPTTYFTAEPAGGGQTPFRVRASIIDNGPLAKGQLIVAVPLVSTVDTLDRLLAVELAVTGAALAAAVFVGWWLVRVGMRPLRLVEGTADAIARGELAQRVPGEEARTEVGHLARALNVMLGRIEQAFAQRDATEDELRESEQRMRQFVADASHELRTPLTAVSAYTELFEQGAVGHPQELERVMHGIHTETVRMGHLVEDLLLLARLDEGRPLAREEVELVGVAAEAVQRASTVGPQWPVTLAASGPVEITGDRSRLQQVLDNLLANVRAHCPPGTSVKVTVTREGNDAVITVTDDGPGLDPSIAEHVFERFYRADPSRSRLHGGAGLGLSIVASIAHAQGGTVAVDAPAEGGARFTMRLPVEGPPDIEDASDSQLVPS